MITTTLDICVREALLEQGLSLHYYLKFLTYAISAFEEYNYDFPFNVKEVKVEPNEFHEIARPQGCLQIVRVSVAFNDRVHALDIDTMINGVENTDSEGRQISWSKSEAGDYFIYAQEENMNANGEYLGRQYGYVGTRKKAWRYISERDVIQLSIDTDNTELYLTYVSDGFSISEANVIHPYAKQMIKDYIHWKACSFGVINQPAYMSDRYKRQFYNQKRLMRERLADISIESIFTTARMAHHSGLKE